MRLFELFEAKPANKSDKIVVKVEKPRNPVLQHAHISGRTAGSHTKPGYNRKVKHKNKEMDE